MDMVYRIIISHGQSAHLAQFPVGVPTVAVFDAYTDADAQMCHELGYAPVVVPRSGNRGANRNAGLQHLLEGALLAPDDIVEFFDGDRYPVHYPPGRMSWLMGAYGLSVLLYTCEQDTRREKIRIGEGSTALVDTGTLCNPFYSCGFAMRAGALLDVCRFNGGPLFEPRFTGWGCEDQYLGLVCDRLGLRVALTTEILLRGSVGGDATMHQGYQASLQQYVDLVREKGLEIRTVMRPVETLT